MKKGFTLIEMIGSIVILSIIALVAFPAVLNMLNTSQGKIDKNMENYVIGATKEYVNDHVNDYPRNSSLDKEVGVSTLISEGYITAKSVSDDMKNDRVRIKVNGSKIYTYQYEIIN